MSDKIQSKLFHRKFLQNEIAYSNLLQKISIFQSKKNLIPCQRILTIQASLHEYQSIEHGT